jgi:hypothetical protein
MSRWALSPWQYLGTDSGMLLHQFPLLMGHPLDDYSLSQACLWYCTWRPSCLQPLESSENWSWWPRRGSSHGTLTTARAASSSIFKDHGDDYQPYLH